MLNQKTLRVIRTLREKSNSKGHHMTVSPGYTNLWSSLISHVKKPNSTYDETDFLLDELNKENKTLHELGEETILLLSNSLKSSSNLYKNTVLPEVAKYKNEVKDMVDAWSKSVPDSDVTVKYLGVPSVLLSNPDIFSLIEGMKGPTLKPDHSSYIIPGIMGEILYNTVTDDIAPSDSDLKLWLASIGAQAFSAYVDNIYRGTDLPTALKLIDYNIEGRLMRSMVAILSAKALKARPPENIPMSLNEYNSKLSKIIAVYSTVLGAIVKTFNGYKATNTLIIKEDKEKRTALIFEPVFAEWVDAEGSFEVLLGKVLSRDAHTTVAGINKNAVKYANTWKRHNDLVLLKKEKKRESVIRSILKSTYSKGLNNPTSAEIDFREKNPNISAQGMQNTAETMIDALTPLQLSSLSTTCMELVTKVRFGHTNAFEFLSSMAASSKADKNSTLDKAVLSATINEMSRFISDSLTEVKG